MKNISLASVIQKNQVSSTDAWLIAMKIHVKDFATAQIVEEIRVINNDEITTIEGEDYEPFPFEIDIKESSSALPTVNVTIQDQTQIVQSYMQRYGGGVGFEIDLMIVRASSATETYIEPELVEYFQVTTSSVADYVVSWDLGAENPLRRQFPKRRQNDDQCGFIYKDPDTCCYAGELGTCDLTLNGANGCRAHNNVANFGAYPGIIVRS